MLVSLATDVDEPVERLRAVAAAAGAAKAQEALLGGELLEDLARMAVPAVSARVVRWAAGLRLFDRLPPMFNLVASTVPGPDFDLWCAGGSRIAALYPVGPITEGVGLNVTAMSYRGTVYFGLLGCRRLVPDVRRLADLVDDELGALFVAALDGSGAGELARSASRGVRCFQHADVAQLVEHNLAKVGVAGSNPVVRSRKPSSAAQFSWVIERCRPDQCMLEERQQAPIGVQPYGNQSSRPGRGMEDLAHRPLIPDHRQCN